MEATVSGTAETWRERIAAHRASGQSIRAWCRENNHHEHAFYWWRSRLGLAHVIVCKLGDHLPLYRLEKIFDRHDVDIARSTMCAWMLLASELVKPLVELMIRRVKQSNVIHTDETRVPVQDGTTNRDAGDGAPALRHRR